MVFCLTLVFLPLSAAAQSGSAGLFFGCVGIVWSGSAQTQAERSDDYQVARRLLDLIVVGRRTQAAFARFLRLLGAKHAEAALATEAALASIRGVSDPICTARWVVANAPEKLAGSWGFRANCQTLFRKVRNWPSCNAGLPRSRR
ncbi:hypothetical protein [Dinoroseobacter shibae]|jgi:hypothetical protein|nr:hypothetical protein [Dinoroseobacter shibae]URF48101.1 hypothetical protein M8008_07400 [Dinoroseobacter shibae]URF52411.1 hypothetical protein M8007_07400 [Dinoroseobacter shibae]